MKLSSLHSFVAAVDAGSLRGAAERLGMSQPALSKLLRELETSVSAKLLTRTSRGVAPTTQGLVLYEHALKVDTELAHARARIHALEGKALGTIHVAAVPVAVVTLLPEAIRTFSRDFPQVKFRIEEELYPASLSRLRNREVDITVAGIPARLPRGEFSITPLIQTSMTIVTRKGSPWCKATSLSQLQSAPWIYTDSKRETGYAADMFAAHDLPPPPCGAVVNSTLAMLSLLQRVDYVALLPSQLASQPWARVHLCQIATFEGMLNLQIGAMVGSSAELKPIVRSFVTHLERAAIGIAVSL